MKKGLLVIALGLAALLTQAVSIGIGDGEIVNLSCINPTSILQTINNQSTCVTPTPSPTSTPTVTSTSTNTVTSTSTVTPTITNSPTPTNTPVPVVSAPVVFVSRKILPNGAVTLPSANDLSGVGPISRFRITTGKLLILNTDGTIKTLIDGTQPSTGADSITDVQAPSVSYDGKTILFAAVQGTWPAADSQPNINPGAWRIYKINADGSGLVQLTFSDQHLDLSQFGGMASVLATYDDTDPAFLPDGRIVFSSTRYPASAEYNAERTTQLFVMNSDGSNMHRITTEKNGADRPIVDPLTGQIVYARWWRNNHFPVNSMATITNPLTFGNTGGYEQFNGLTIDPSQAVGDGLNRNFWFPGIINPDGTGIRAFHLTGRDFNQNQYYGGAFNSLGQLLANFVSDFPITQEAGFGGIRQLLRGTLPYASIVGQTSGLAPLVQPGSFGVPVGPYAVDPDVFNDGSLVFSLAPDINQDYGLYKSNSDGSGMQLLYDNPGTAETGARVIASRPLPPIIQDKITTIAPPLPPVYGSTSPVDGYFNFVDYNIYANGPIDGGIVAAPAVGSASLIRFFIDQQGTHSSDQPQYDWPTEIGDMTIKADGSFTNTNALADVTSFEQLRGPTGLVPTTGGNGAAQVFGQNFGRPGETMACVGCHAGHSMIKFNPATAIWSNLAPGAQVSVSSTINPLNNAGLNNLKVRTDYLINKWYSAPGQTQNQWVKLTFPVPVTVRTVALYDTLTGNGGQAQYGTVISNLHITGATVLLQDINGNTLASQTVGDLTLDGVNANFSDVPNVVYVVVQINGFTGSISGIVPPNQQVVGLSQVSVISHG